MKKAIAPWLMGAALCGLAVACNGNSKSEPPGPTGPLGPAPQPVPIRRLTTGEYVATVADLFPGYPMPQYFVPRTRRCWVPNFSSSQTGSLVRAEQYEAAGDAIARRSPPIRRC